MAEQVSLRSMYRSKLSSLSNTDLGWVAFCRDHYYHIKSKSTIVELNPFRHNTLKYRLTDFLMDNGLPPETAWIVLMVNQLGSDKDFSDLRVMFIPDISDIQHLREVYDTTVSHAKREREKTE